MSPTPVMLADVRCLLASIAFQVTPDLFISWEAKEGASIAHVGTF